VVIDINGISADQVRGKDECYQLWEEEKQKAGAI